eukprot:TRINITY_DN5973_c1_g4_i1.p1 TRINITY_DN5973_c1_g4~~TRINITY_DN5973_c1_g4_i1.p1  ORF type:complete len:178 (-),score=38.98 TRINITY_DN5973_c1_g4_i1:266-757(-)
MLSSLTIQVDRILPAKAMSSSNQSIHGVITVHVVVISDPDSDEGLNQTYERISTLDLHELAEKLPDALQKHGCTKENSCTVPAGLACSMEEAPERSCANAKTWAAGLGCSSPPPSHAGFPLWIAGAIGAAVLLIAAAGVAYWTSCFGCCKSESGERLLERGRR